MDNKNEVIRKCVDAIEKCLMEYRDYDMAVTIMQVCTIADETFKVEVSVK